MILNAVVQKSLQEPTDNVILTPTVSWYWESSKGKLAIQLKFGYNIAIS